MHDANLDVLLRRYEDREDHGCVPCGACGCCPHRAKNYWCPAKDGLEGSRCPGENCGCEGGSEWVQDATCPDDPPKPEPDPTLVTLDGMEYQ